MIDYNNTVAMDPLVLILPDVTKATMVKLLTWSINGLICVTRQERDSISSIFNAMQVNKDMISFIKVEQDATTNADLEDKFSTSANLEPNSKRRRLQIPGNDSLENDFRIVSNLNPEPGTSAKVDDVVKLESFVDNDYSESSSSDEDDGIGQKWKCPSCSVEASSRKGAAIHLLCDHYGQEMLKLWGDRDYEEPCPFCTKLLFANVDKPLQKQEMFQKVCKHVGKYHRKVKPFAANSRELEVIFSNAGQKCPVCFGRYNGLHCLRSHLANLHFKEKLLALASRKDSHCQICFKKVSVKNWPYHIGMTHHYLVEVMPEVCKKAAFPSLFKRKRRLIPLKTEVRQDGKKGANDNKHKTSSLYSAKALELANHDRKFCDFCSEFFPNALFKKHLAGTHFKKELLELAGYSGSRDKCGICGEVVVSWIGEVGAVREVKMAQHVGLVHNMLDKVMPTVKIEVVDHVEEDPLSGL